MRGDGGAFTTSFEAALRTAPRDIDIWCGLITTLIAAGLYDDALAAVSRAREAAGGERAFDAFEAVCVAERGETEKADRLFAALGPLENINDVLRLVRHLLRSGRPAERPRPPKPGSPTISITASGPIWRLPGD